MTKIFVLLLLFGNLSSFSDFGNLMMASLWKLVAEGSTATLPHLLFFHVSSQMDRLTSAL